MSAPRSPVPSFQYPSILKETIFKDLITLGGYSAVLLELFHELSILLGRKRGLQRLHVYPVEVIFLPACKFQMLSVLDT